MMTAEKYGILMVCSSIAYRSARSDIDPENKSGRALKRKEAHIMAKKKAAKKTTKKKATTKKKK
jgi:hypothetical protein